MTSEHEGWDARRDGHWDDAGFRAEIGDALQDFVRTQAEWLDRLGPDAQRLVEHARVSVSGGKRFRAAFCWWGHHAVAEPADPVALVRACASLELLHASALVHDDYMDASDVRRGRPATHRAFEQLHREHGWAASPEQYGASAAILLGDLLLSWSDELLRTCGLPADRVLDALGYFDLTRSEVVTGQFLDVSAQARGEADVDTAMTVLLYKSAKYSIERPLHIGAALAGASPEMITQLSRFGLPLGEAFQLRDDLLGVFGDPAVTGKPAGDDLIEGKRTVLVSLALDALPADRVLDALGYFDLTRSEVVTGQFLDVSAQARGAADVDTAMTVLRYKSAKYSIERPLHIGAALAGASPEMITQLSRFGLPLGEAFQLRDDLLGVFGDPAVTGKPAGDDLIEGKRTVLVSLALDALPVADAKVLDSALGTALDPDQVEHLCRLIDDSGARIQVEAVISQLTERSLAALAASDITDTARGVLAGLAAQVTQRAV